MLLSATPHSLANRRVCQITRVKKHEEDFRIIALIRDLNPETNRVEVTYRFKEFEWKEFQLLPGAKAAAFIFVQSHHSSDGASGSGKTIALQSVGRDVWSCLVGFSRTSQPRAGDVLGLVEKKVLPNAAVKRSCLTEILRINEYHEPTVLSPQNCRREYLRRENSFVEDGQQNALLPSIQHERNQIRIRVKECLQVTASVTTQGFSSIDPYFDSGW